VKQTLFSTTLDNGIVLLGEELPGLESVAVAFQKRLATRLWLWGGECCKASA
jgi:hypothetical protein